MTAIARPIREGDAEPPRRTRATSFASRVVAAAARPTRPWLHVNASPRVARFLVEAGARRGKVLLGNVDLRREDPCSSSQHRVGVAGKPSSADPRSVDLRGAVLSGADLSQVDLHGADLSGAILRDADLTGADLSYVGLRGADLTGADLTSANLTSADLTNASLYEADLSDAGLVGVLWSATTRWPKDVMTAMKERSDEVRPGVWRVAGSGGADVEVGTPLVTV
jgi:Pentapeptide repeats (8 copies)